MVIKPKKVGELAVIIVAVKALSHLVKYLVLYINVNCGPKLTITSVFQLCLNVISCSRSKTSEQKF